MTCEIRHSDHDEMLADLAANGLYDPRFEHDACGIGFVAHVDGRRNHRVLQMALEALCNHAHRGAVADDRKSGDGAGVLSQLPHEFFNRELLRMGIEPPHAADLAVGQFFLNLHNGADRAKAREIVREVLTELRVEVLTFRSVPVIEAALGRRAEQSRPWMEQVLIRRTEAACEAGDAFERLLYLARKKIARRARDADVHRLYIASMSSRTIVYKGLVLAEELEHFYPDLSDPDFKTAIAVFHQRYSTNTFPRWELAQPFRLLCHNGEINTVQGNVNWMEARQDDLASPLWDDAIHELKPIIGAQGSDSSKMDNELELLTRSGRDVRHALMMMVPEAWERMSEREVTPERRAFYEYHSALIEPWDGPAAITYTDGRFVGTLLDRNGLRPARYVVLDNGYVISSSEVGAVAYDEGRVVKKGSLGPGQIFCVDTARGMIMEDEEITQRFASRQPYDRWVHENLIDLDAVVHSAQSDEPAGDAYGAHDSSIPLAARQASFGYTSEEMVVVLRPMVTEGKEPVGAMGDDTPPAALSNLPTAALQLLQAALCRGDQPAHRSPARGHGDEHSHTAGTACQHSCGDAGGNPADQAGLAIAPAGTTGCIAVDGRARVQACHRRRCLVAPGRTEAGCGSVCRRRGGSRTARGCRSPLRGRGRGDHRRGYDSVHQ